MRTSGHLRLLVVATLAGLAVSALATSGAIATGGGVTVAPYGTDDAGGFRNVLPSGENGLDNVLQLAAFRLNGSYPPHSNDQLPLYAGLLYASPTLTHGQIANYFKDATFGVKPGDVASVESPRADTKIVRDKSYGVPHVYGSTRGGVQFGAGYAAAEDRLFLMDVLRHTGRGELSSFAGGSDGNRAMDRVQWSIAPYAEADLQSQIDDAGKLYGAAGLQVVDDVKNFVAGINAYLDIALLNPTLLPGEYAAIGQVPQPWTPTDVIAEASLIGGIFGKGGGQEVSSARTLQAFEEAFGTNEGRATWSDFREHNDIEAPTTVSQPFPYETDSPFSPTGLAMPDPRSVSFVPDGPSLSTAASASLGRTHTPLSQVIPNDGSIGSRLLRQVLAGPPLASNWELVSARRSATGHAIGVMGPQVGYYVPEILMEEDLHGPGFDARGAAFPGVNLYVELGHGRDYAWSATTAGSDNVDTFAEVLCQDDHHYLYKGSCLPMEQLDRRNSWKPNLADQTPPGSETLTIYRTVHGLVYARGTVGGQKVAFASARTTYFHEADSALGFSELNDPNVLTGPKPFQKAVSKINFGFNWSYLDANHIAYYHSGWFPQRASGTSPDFPILGTGQFDWRGYDPNLHTLDLLPFDAHPNAIDPDYEVSWNNKQAPEWSAADETYYFGPEFRSQLIANFIQQALANAGTMRIEQLVSAMDEAASQDIRSVQLWPLLKSVLGTPADPRLQDAIATLDSWYADGGHRRDLTNRDITRPGTYQHNSAIAIMDAWWPKLIDAEFRPALGDGPFRAVHAMLSFGAPDPGGQPGSPDFAVGWYGQVSKDLRDLLAAAGQGPTPGDPYSRIYCGSGSFADCRTALRNSLLAALTVTPQQIYGHGDCAENPQASCFDMNRWVVAGGISVPPFPFQNRPTFQQVVEPARTLPR